MKPLVKTATSCASSAVPMLGGGAWIPGFTTLQDLAGDVGLSDRHVSKILRLAYLAPDVLETLLIKRTPPAVSLARLVEIVNLPWTEQAAEVFGPP